MGTTQEAVTCGRFKIITGDRKPALLHTGIDQVEEVDLKARCSLHGLQEAIPMPVPDENQCIYSIMEALLSLGVGREQDPACVTVYPAVPLEEWSKRKRLWSRI
jgi:hypothetical protein